MTFEDKNVSSQINMSQTGGWDYTYVMGNFLIIDLGFWFQPIVSNLFINLHNVSSWWIVALTDLFQNHFLADNHKDNYDMSSTHYQLSTALIRNRILKLLFTSAKINS